MTVYKTTTQVAELTFEDILKGELGADERLRAKEYLEKIESPAYEDPIQEQYKSRDYIAEEAGPRCYDTRVFAFEEQSSEYDSENNSALDNTTAQVNTAVTGNTNVAGTVSDTQQFAPQNTPTPTSSGKAKITAKEDEGKKSKSRLSRGSDRGQAPSKKRNDVKGPLPPPSDDWSVYSITRGGGKGKEWLYQSPEGIICDSSELAHRIHEYHSRKWDVKQVPGKQQKAIKFLKASLGAPQDGKAPIHTDARSMVVLHRMLKSLEKNAAIGYPIGHMAAPRKRPRKSQSVAGAVE